MDYGNAGGNCYGDIGDNVGSQGSVFSIGTKTTVQSEAGLVIARQGLGQVGPDRRRAASALLPDYTVKHEGQAKRPCYRLLDMTEEILQKQKSCVKGTA